jgi:hypothetical protein
MRKPSSSSTISTDAVMGLLLDLSEVQTAAHSFIKSG